MTSGKKIRVDIDVEVFEEMAGLNCQLFCEAVK
jgi:hypothetical protein